MMESLHQDPSSHPGVSQFATSAPSFRIKRPGARPLVFEGIELGMAMSFTPALPYWYEVNLYRTTDKRFVATIKLFYRAETEQDAVKAWDFDSLEQALDKLATYDAGEDVRVTLDLSDLTTSAAELAAYAMELRAKVVAARRHYASLVGEFFYELDLPKAAPSRTRI